MRTSISQLSLWQARNISEAWKQEEQDCAGLVRFVYRESLKKRTLLQRNILKLPVKLQFPTVSDNARNLFPNYPKIWKTFQGYKYDFFADAENLVINNFTFVSFNLNELKEGDLLVYKKNDASIEPWHLMIYAGHNPKTGVVVYHNGAKKKHAQVRIVSLLELVNSPDPQWIPSEKNDQFLGVFRWNFFLKEKNTLLL